MPPPQKPSIWPFIKEIFFDKETVVGFIKRHKIVTLLTVTNLLLFFMLMFITEQSVMSKRSELKVKQEYALLKLQYEQRQNCALDAEKARNDYVQCRGDLEYTQEDYRRVSQALNRCMEAKPVGQSTPPAPQKPKPKPEPVIVNRSPSNDDDIRRKLEAIRD